MKMTDWMLTCAPGSVGSVAKVMATIYSAFRQANPALSKKELLLKTLKSRCPAMSESKAEEIVKAAGNQLEYVILQVLWREHPGYRKAFAKNRLRYAEMLDTVKRMTDVHAPGA